MDVPSFLNQLNKHRKPKSTDLYDRVTHCNLVLFHEQKPHKFEVRGWTYDANKDTIEISVVNWTLCAGAATITVDKESDPNYFFILEDSPTLQVLFDK